MQLEVTLPQNNIDKSFRIQTPSPQLITSLEQLYSNVFNQRKDSKGSKLHKNHFQLMQIKLAFQNINQTNPNNFLNNNFTQPKILQFLQQSVSKMHGKIHLSQLMSCLEIKYVSGISKQVDIQLNDFTEQFFHQFWSSISFGTIAGNNALFNVRIKQIKAKFVPN